VLLSLAVGANPVLLIGNSPTEIGITLLKADFPNLFTR
jgi:hypothetical protein